MIDSGDRHARDESHKTMIYHFQNRSFQSNKHPYYEMSFWWNSQNSDIFFRNME